MQPQPVTLFGEPVQWVDTTRYLGVTLDKRLTWSPHIDQFRKKTAQRMGMLGPLLNRNNDLSVRNGVLLYKQLIRPMMDYACPAWRSAARTHVRRLQVLKLVARRQFCCKSMAYGVKQESAHCQTCQGQANTVLELGRQPPTIMCTDCRAPWKIDYSAQAETQCPRKNYVTPQVCQLLRNISFFIRHQTTSFPMQGHDGTAVPQ
jgi:hypothetical protein